MKITKSDLKQIIKEEVTKLLTENEDQQYALKILDLLNYKDHEDPDYFAQGVSLYSTLKDDIEANAPTENDQILKKLEVINQFAYSGIEDVNFLSGLSELNVTKKIWLGWCRSLENVDGLEGLTNLTDLFLNRCSKLQNIDGLKGLTNLTYLYLTGGKSLQNVDGLEGCTNLTTLSLYGCSSLQNVDVLKGLTNLTWLNLSGCSSLPPELQRLFESDSSGTAYEQFMKALNAPKGN